MCVTDWVMLKIVFCSVVLLVECTKSQKLNLSFDSNSNLIIFFLDLPRSHPEPMVNEVLEMKMELQGQLQHAVSINFATK